LFSQGSIFEFGPLRIALCPLRRKDLPCTYLAHHEPERVIVVVVILNF